MSEEPLKRQTLSLEDALKYFQKPCIIGLCADPDEGKSNTIYYLIKELQRRYNFNLYSYGLKINLSEQKIYSLEELESIKNGIIFIDEFYSLFDLEDRKKRLMIEKTLRLLFHNNNVIVLCGLPDNFKKFISSKLEIILYKKCTLSNFINGSVIKNKALQYSGQELGSAVLNIPKDECLVFDGKHYHHLETPYLRLYDTKKNNESLLVAKNVQ